MPESEIERLQRHITSLQKIDLSRELFSVRLAVTQVLEEKMARLRGLGAEAVPPDQTRTSDDVLAAKLNELLMRMLVEVYESGG